MFSIEECMTQNAFDQDTIPQALKNPKSPRSKLTVKSAAEFGYPNVAITYPHSERSRTPLISSSHGTQGAKTWKLFSSRHPGTNHRDLAMASNIRSSEPWATHRSLFRFLT
ncbi:hypothetical protein CNMCM8980_010103 [Aspergillus fumigatiaffinis]|uniref:Uncharacterized protein n=1 Tax=Aspergillus fumigatiaffinis TaxID=340414 RepID=A0A8H4MF98_9EURO|nr:hypothetical protein CNMCM6805_002051 [Aspergillus fumigatiaffinis]KAF4250781.1 hypothetical protein CNMCM8980_010103 [Aspergillus fumigatiaffinis]